MPISSPYSTAPTPPKIVDVGLVNCPHCKGEGKLNIEVLTHATAGSTACCMRLTCITCVGTGRITLARAEAFEADLALWCRCGSDDAPTYHADGEHTEVWKHHWRCPACGKIQQIG